MFRNLFMLFLIFSSTLLCAQTIEDFNKNRLKHNKNSMLVLGSWATVNIFASPILMANTNGSEYYFHEMNLYWNIVNLGIAIPGYLAAKKGETALGIRETIHAQYQGEKIYLFNSGLDMLYIMSGLFLREQTDEIDKQVMKDRLTGYGNSIAFQGAFLLVFDLFHVITLKKQHKALNKILDGMAITHNGIILQYHF